MRRYIDIICDLKDGKKPEYEEVRLACIMAADLLFFAEGNVKKLLKPECSDFMRNFVANEEEKRFFTKKMSPVDFLGESNHPDNPDYKRRVEIGNRLVDRIAERQRSKE